MRAVAGSIVCVVRFAVLFGVCLSCHFEFCGSERDAGIFADAERVELLWAKSFKLTFKICVYRGFFG